eukprot:1148607-Pelagomonas_calceolata.AAC.10
MRGVRTGRGGTHNHAQVRRDAGGARGSQRHRYKRCERFTEAQVQEVRTGTRGAGGAHRRAQAQDPNGNRVRGNCMEQQAIKF